MQPRKRKDLTKTDMLSEGLSRKRLDHIRTHVRNLWSESIGLPVYYTLHDHRHNQEVEKALYKLIPRDKYSQFSEEERFYLLASAWLHDVGMIPSLFGDEVDSEQVRRTHHLRSQKYINGAHHLLGLEEDEALVIGEICRFHRKVEDISECSEGYGAIRLQLLAAYLRLADAIHIDITRFNQSLFRIFLRTGMPWETKLHWLKSFWVKEVEPDFDRLILRIYLRISKKDSQNVEVISDIIRDELRTELFSVRDILIRGGVSYFLHVETNYGIGVGRKQGKELQLVISNFQLERKPSATDVVNIVIDTILQILELPERDAYSMLQEYQTGVIQNVVENRPCHVLLAKINEFVKMHSNGEAGQVRIREIRNRINRVRAVVQRLKFRRAKRIEALVGYSRAILNDCGSILLFGYSNLVIKSLQMLEDEVKRETKIYVCECRNRDQYNDIDELVYCDGIEYVSRIREIGCEKVYIVPDILVGNLMSRELISKVIFGANGVDIESGEIGHTAGHLAIAGLAGLHKIPVYVVVDSYKFGFMNHDAYIERKINWLTSNRKMLSKLKGVPRLNPREDVVGADRLYAFVTDYGIFPPDKIPEAIKENIDIVNQQESQGRRHPVYQEKIENGKYSLVVHTEGLIDALDDQDYLRKLQTDCYYSEKETRAILQEITHNRPDLEKSTRRRLVNLLAFVEHTMFQTLKTYFSGEK